MLTDKGLSAHCHAACSPYCPHCIDFAPTFQTLYEFYYTSKSTPETKFSDYYDIRFGRLNCIAYSDLCGKHEIRAFPTTITYDKNVTFGKLVGAKNITMLSNLIEGALEEHKPGSRPKELLLPAPGDTVFPKADGDGKAPLSGDKDKTGKTDDKTAKTGKTDDKTAKTAKMDKTAKTDDKTGKTDTKTGKTDAKTGKTVKTDQKPLTTHSSAGTSIKLTAESFQKDVTMSQEPWLIKFYAPWCHHCQALAPTWDQLAKTMRDKLNVAEVDCVKESRLCKDIGVKAYPTIMFFKEAERAEYIGLRGLGDLVQYAEKAVDLAAGVPDVDAESFKALEDKEDVIFVYFYDHATTSEDFRALERLPLGLIGHAKLVKTKDAKMNDRFKITTWPRLLVSREGRPTYYAPLTPNEMRDVNTVHEWMRSVWLPLVPELTPSNARQIMDGKLVVLGILNRQDQDAFTSALREMKSAANEWMDRQIQEFQLERKKLRDSKQMRIEEAEDRDDQRALRAAKAIRINMDNAGRKEVTFAWADGAYWQRWIRTTYGIDVKDGERIIINDEEVRKPRRDKSRRDGRR